MSDAPNPASETQIPLSPEMVILEARELHRVLTREEKPYSAGVLADCITTIENLLSRPAAQGQQPCGEIAAILDLYFAPWGAAKAARWEALTKDTPFDPELVLKLLHSKLKGVSVSSTPRATAAPEWQDIETAPHETRVLLGWIYDGAWFCETGMASHGWRRNGISNMSRHGQATHWQPLPEGPELTSPARESQP